MFKPRACQQDVLKYTTGKMGVSAVPGSGKTQTLSYLASQIISKGLIRDDQQVLVVTLVNSAVTNFSQRVDSFVEEYGLMPRMGYRVRTLHGLAHDIVRERPALVGLANDFEIVDERVADQILDSIVNSWLAAHPDLLEEYLDPMLVMDDRTTRKVTDSWYKDVRKVAQAFIKQAKDLELNPLDIQHLLENSSTYLPLVEMGWSIYADYQRALNNRCAVDFDDLIRLALQALHSDPEYLSILQDRFPYILEDESQDSSRLQEKILRCLVGVNGNWVRVGDPNQAIYETFTTASPMYLRNFLTEQSVNSVKLPVSGRSTQSIIGLANALIDWTRIDHPNPSLRDSLVLPYIKSTEIDDPQPNPLDRPDSIFWYDRKLSPEEELNVIADSLKRWLPDHPDWTVAVLVPRNDRGADLVNELKKRSIPYVEILRSSQSTREAAGSLSNIVRFLADPLKPSLLSTVYRVWRRDERSDESRTETIKKLAQTIQRCSQVEDYLFPRPGMDWLDTLRDSLPIDMIEELCEFRAVIQRWQGATLLPIDQLILTLAQEIFTAPADLAVAYKLALLLDQVSKDHQDWRLPQLTEELTIIAKNERKFLGMSDDDTGFDPAQHKGKVVVATMHKAKGLEWDRVYLTSVNSYDFPSALPGDQFVSERWYLRDRLNLEAELVEQLNGLTNGNTKDTFPPEGLATERSRIAYASERLRLFYVGITRAKQDLIVTWNTGRNGDCQPAAAFIALKAKWEEQQHDPTS